MGSHKNDDSKLTEAFLVTEQKFKANATGVLNRLLQLY